jgi:short-subunit dehydrogenase
MTISFALSDFDFEILLFFIGFYFLALWTSRYARLAFRHFFATPCTPARYGQQSWALVTGGASGQGLAASLELARRGFHVVLASNSREDLEKAKAKLKAQFPNTQCRVLPPFEFEKHTSAAQLEQKIVKPVSDLDIGVVFHAASFVAAQQFERLSLEEVHAMMTVNCYSATLLTKLLLPKFQQRFSQHGKRSLVVMAGAGASLAPTPYLQLFSACKVYQDYLAEGLNFELSGQGVDFLSLRSFGLIAEEKEAEARSIVPSDTLYSQVMGVTAAQSVRAALDKCTSVKNFGAWQHEIAGTVLENVLDLLPFETRMLVTAPMGKKFVENFGAE